MSLPLATRRTWVEPNPGFSIRRQCRLAGVPRSGFYYDPVPESAENLLLMRLIYEEYMRHVDGRDKTYQKWANESLPPLEGFVF